MTELTILRRAILTLAVAAGPAAAQRPASPDDASRTAGDSIGSGPRIAIPAIRIQHLRPRDQRGVGVFEPPKHDTVSYQGFAMQWGAAFTQEYQKLGHRNSADPRLVNGINQNDLIGIGQGFNNAVANLYLDAQLARGIRVELTSYLSARHHQETWVKDGYFLIDGSPFDNRLLDRLFETLTLRVGHFEVNYGDQHFRRSDNGEAMYNPLVGNYILDAFTTEIGGEAYWRQRGLILMGALTGGEVHGQVTAPERRSPAYLAKIGVDTQLTRTLRVRLTGSTYGSSKSASNTLYTGDRAGSPYYDVLEPVGSTETANAWSGNVRPGFTNVVHAYVVNPFVVYRGLELFGNIETATGKGTAEPSKRTVRQLAGEATVRFAPRRQLYAAARYNRVAGQLAGIANDITVHRWQAGGGWFVTPLVLAKAEYVSQRYREFPTTDIRSGGGFDGLMITGTVAF